MSLSKAERRRRWARKRVLDLNALGLNSRGQPLKKRKWRLFGPHGAVLHGRARDNARQRQLRGDLVAAGLTTKGAERKVKLWPELKSLSRKERHRIRVREYNRRLMEAGLTARGTPRQRSWSYYPATQQKPFVKIPEKEQRWREFRATIPTKADPLEEAA